MLLRTAEPCYKSCALFIFATPTGTAMRRLLICDLFGLLLHKLRAVRMKKKVLGLVALCICALLVYLLTASVRRNATAIRAPVNCSDRNSESVAPSCGEDISLDAAKLSFKTVTNHEKLFTVTEDNVCDSASTIGLYYYWAPVERYEDGSQALELLRKRASTGIPFTRDALNLSDLFMRERLKNLDPNLLQALKEKLPKHVIVESSRSTNEEQHLALCGVSVVGDAVGPPTNCVTVAIITSTETWLRGGNANQSSCYMMASYRNSGAIDITFEVNTRSDPLNFSNAMTQTLKNDLELSVDQEISKDQSGHVDSVLLKSASSLRNSKILPRGWREWLDFDLFLTTSDGKISIRGIAHVLVCRQNLFNVSDFNGPDDAQRSLYGSKLDTTVNNAIKSVCEGYRPQDTKTIFCSP
jgi:hypothetical protein